jgi:hypothetical protein
MLTNETFLLIKPFTAVVGSNGQASVSITQSLQGMVWQIYQIGFSLGKPAPSPQVGAHFNGIPLTSTVTMQTVSFTGVPYAMESFFVGPPYVGLKAGDAITCSVLGAISADTFTAGAYISEETDPAIGARNWWYSNAGS